MGPYSSLDCDFTTGKCPTCGKERSPGVRRNCPAKFKKHGKPASRPGTEFFTLTQALGINRKKDCKCAAIAAEMNRLGPAGCREHREELLAKLRENYQLYDWKDKFKAAWAAVTSGLALNPLDPLGSLLDEAIRRAEDQSSESSGSSHSLGG